jgi:hypothetical protein
MLVYRKNIISGKVNTMSLPVTQKQLDIYENTNVNVQDIFPDLDADQREFLISGFMPGEFEHHVDEFESEFGLLTEDETSNYVKGGKHD